MPRTMSSTKLAPTPSDDPLPAHSPDAQRPIVVVNSTKQFPLTLPNVTLISARKYIGNPEFASLKKAKVYNLCSSYRYQSWGYYVSLLADARGHKIFPSVTSIRDFKSSTIVKSISDELDELLQSALRKVKGNKFELFIYFSCSFEPEYEKLAKELYSLFQAPLLRATFAKEEYGWELQNISPVSIHSVPERDLPYLQQRAQEYFASPQPKKRTINRPYFDLAILVDPDEIEPPSDKVAINKFIKLGNDLNINVELITKEDYSHIPEFDALFIRTTTAVNHYTYRFARYAQTEGLAVIDDPVSILKCTNKVYLAELLQRAQIKTPLTYLVHAGNDEELAKTIAFPCVLKQPDGSSSRGVSKVNNGQEFLTSVKELLKDSDLILAQEFTPTEFDWRVVVLDKQPLVVCKYHMPANHWQIYKWDENDPHPTWGKTEVIPLDQVPKQILKIGLQAASLIGDGFYGVDLKQHGTNISVIEVNDNPSLENKFEDQLLKDDLYRMILNSFARRVAALNASKNVEI